MDVQHRYWQAYVDLVRNAAYTNLYKSKTEAIDWRLNVVSAVMSSASIGGWAIWKDYAFLWGIMIAASQLLQVLKPYLPYKKRFSALSHLSADLDGLVIVAEEEWHKISRGLLNVDQIQKALTNLRRKNLDFVKRSFGAASLPENKNLLAVADAQAKQFVTVNYGV